MLFQDRIDAARALAQALQPWRGKHPLILAIPRGGVPMGKLIADELEGDLDVVLIRKLRAPGNPEFAIGAVAESGWVHLSDNVSSPSVSDAYLDREITSQLDAIHQRRSRYGETGHPLSPANRIVIVVDDGLATGETMIAALHATHENNPAQLICAVPVAAIESLEKIRNSADEVVCLHAMTDFSSVGQFYGNFSSVPEEEVVEILRNTRPRRRSHG
jgi:putative phosphoribosyl transferase